MKFLVKDLPQKAKVAVEIGNVYPAKVNQKIYASFNEHEEVYYWLVVAVDEKRVSLLGLTKEGTVATTCNCLKGIIEERPLIGVSSTFRNLTIGIIPFSPYNMNKINCGCSECEC